MAETLESNVIRHLILKAKMTGGGQNSKLRVADIVKAVVEGAVEKGFLKEPLRLELEYYNPLFDKIVAVIWELIIEGVYTPGSGMPNSNLPFLRATEHGRKCFEAGELTAHDPDDYLRRLKAACPSIDEITLLYTGEALDTFRVGKHLAATVMIGVAAENMLLRLVAAVHSALDVGLESAKTMGRSLILAMRRKIASLKAPCCADTPMRAVGRKALIISIWSVRGLCSGCRMAPRSGRHSKRF